MKGRLLSSSAVTCARSWHFLPFQLRRRHGPLLSVGDFTPLLLIGLFQGLRRIPPALFTSTSRPFEDNPRSCSRRQPGSLRTFPFHASQ